MKKDKVPLRNPVAHHIYRFNKPKIELDKRAEKMEATHEDELETEINEFEGEEE